MRNSIERPSGRARMTRDGKADCGASLNLCAGVERDEVPDFGGIGSQCNRVFDTR